MWGTRIGLTIGLMSSMFLGCAKITSLLELKKNEVAADKALNEQLFTDPDELITKIETDSTVTISNNGADNIVIAAGRTWEADVSFNAPQGNVIGLGLRFGDTGPVFVFSIPQAVGQTQGQLKKLVEIPDGVCFDLPLVDGEPQQSGDWSWEANRSGICHNTVAQIYAVTVDKKTSDPVQSNGVLDCFVGEDACSELSCGRKLDRCKISCEEGVYDLEWTFQSQNGELRGPMTLALENQSEGSEDQAMQDSIPVKAYFELQGFSVCSASGQSNLKGVVDSAFSYGNRMVFEYKDTTATATVTVRFDIDGTERCTDLSGTVTIVGGACDGVSSQFKGSKVETCGAFCANICPRTACPRSCEESCVQACECSGPSAPVDFFGSTVSGARLAVPAKDAECCSALSLEAGEKGCMCPAVGLNGIRAQLTWETPADVNPFDEFGADIDLHMAKGDAEWFSSPGDVYFDNPNPSWGRPEDPEDDPYLDIDDVDGAGPEQIVLEYPEVGEKYRFAIHNARSILMMSDFGPSNVTLRVWARDELIYEYSYGIGRYGFIEDRFWDVFYLTWADNNEDVIMSRRNAEVPLSWADLDNLSDGAQCRFAVSDCFNSSTRRTSSCPVLVTSNPTCKPSCASTADCPSGDYACRPSVGEISTGYCHEIDTSVATASVGDACTDTDECRDGICFSGACRKICQRSSDCGANENCLLALFNPSDTGGVDENRLTSACYPSAGLRAEGESCIDNSDPMNPQISPALCSSGVCDVPEYFFRRDALGQANAQPLCSRMCVSNSDCPSGNQCLLANHIYGLTSGQATPVRFPDAGSRSYYDGVRGCFSAVAQAGQTDTSTGGWRRYSTGSIALGSPCVRTSTVQFLGTSECSSGPCLSVADRSASLTEGYCSKSCVRDSECDNPSTPGWVCSNSFGQLSSPILKLFPGAFFSVFDRYHGGFLCVPPPN